MRETISLHFWLCGGRFSAFLPPMIGSLGNSLLILRNFEKGDLSRNLRCYIAFKVQFILCSVRKSELIAQFREDVIFPAEHQEELAMRT